MVNYRRICKENGRRPAIDRRRLFGRFELNDGEGAVHLVRHEADLVAISSGRASVFHAEDHGHVYVHSQVEQRTVRQVTLPAGLSTFLTMLSTGCTTAVACDDMAA
jgi:hypothetical protein